MSTSPPVPQSPPSGPKKSSPLLWILIGIAGFFLLIGIVVMAGGYFVYTKAKQMADNPGMAVAKILAATNPDVEIVSTDDRKGVITIKDKKTGKIVTMNLSDIKDGKLTLSDGKESVSLEAKGDGASGGLEMKSSEGTVKIGAGGKLPDWVPAYPGATAAGTYSMQSSEGDAGTFAFQTKDAVDKVVAFYSGAMKTAGLKVTSNITQQDGKTAGGMVSGEDASKSRTLVLILGTSDEGTAVSLTFKSKK